MKIFALSSYGFGAVVFVALLAACSGSQPPIAAPSAVSQGAEVISQAHEHAFLARQELASANGIYVSENQSSESHVFGYPIDNKKNRAPICSEKAQTTYDVAVDGVGNLIVPNPDDSIAVFQGPGMCGRELGSFHTIPGDNYPVDATSANAASGTIAVGILLDGGSGVGSIELCTLTKGCTQNLTGGQMDFVAAVAMSKKGDCWASSAVPTALTYFKGCSGTAHSATGYENSDAGGLDIDGNGNLVSISCSQASCSTPVLYVYSGCNPKCVKVGGPFPLHGASWYGHLNANSTRFAAADYEYGQIDVYSYAPSSLTYLYSFDNGLSTGGNLGVAYNPRSKE